MSHDAPPLLPPHKFVDDCEVHGPRPRVPGQETRIQQMTETPPSGGGGGGGSGGSTIGAAADCASGTAEPTTATSPPNVASQPPPSSLPATTSAATPHSGPSTTSTPTTSSHPNVAAATAATTASAVHIAPSDWHQGLINLLDDSRGAESFKGYVEQHGGIHRDRLNFYFACEGLKQQTEDAQIKQMVSAIYKFLRKSKIALSNELRARIKSGLAAGAPAMDAHIFRGMQLEVVQTICDTTYPHFLQSEQYIQLLNETAEAATGSAAAAQPAAAASVQQQQQQQPQQYPSAPQQHYDQHQLPDGPLPWMAAAATTSSSHQPHKSATMPSHHRSLSTPPPPPQQLSSRTLMTLHEDSELSSCAAAALPMAAASACASSSMPLTMNSLRATEGPRLGVRPNGAHGYVGQFSSAYNPVSLQNSECMSVSSGGHRGDPDRRRSSAREGRPEHHRRSERSGGGTLRPSDGPGGSGIADEHHINHNLTNLTVQNMQLPMHSSMRGTHINKSAQLTDEKFKNLVITKLEAIKYQQDHGGDTSTPRSAFGQSTFMNGDGYASALTFEDDNDQSILDKHVSRVWDKSPLRSPGTKSPYPSGDMFGGAPPPPRSAGQRAMDGSGVGGSGAMDHHSFGGGSMRHTRSMPDRRSAGGVAASHGKGMPPAGGMYTMEPAMLKSRMDSTSRTRSMVTDVACSNTLEEASRRLEDVNRISRHLPPHYAHEAPLPPPPAHVNAKSHDATVALIKFDDDPEPYPYRYFLAGLQPTLRQVKEILPRKGNFRFFFKTACDDPDCPVIQVEIRDDADSLPLFEGKVDCRVKRYE